MNLTARKLESLGTNILGLLRVIFHFLGLQISRKSVLGDYFYFFWSPKQIQDYQQAKILGTTCVKIWQAKILGTTCVKIWHGAS